MLLYMLALQFAGICVICAHEDNAWVGPVSSNISMLFIVRSGATFKGLMVYGAV